MVTGTASITIDLEVRPNGTWRSASVVTETRNGVARPVENKVEEGIEWREVSPGRYLVKKTASNTPKYYRLIGGRAFAEESEIMTRVR